MDRAEARQCGFDLMEAEHKAKQIEAFVNSDYGRDVLADYLHVLSSGPMDINRRELHLMDAVEEWE